MDKFVVSIPKGIKKRKVEETDHPPPTSNKVSRKTISSNGVQMYLDFGQKSFGKSIQCAKCGLLYVVSDKEDDKEHSKFCRQVSRETYPHHLYTLDKSDIYSLYNFQLSRIRMDLHWREKSMTVAAS